MCLTWKKLLVNNSANMNERLKSVLSNSQICKAKLDELTAESKRINNNLKLYFIINILTENRRNDPSQQKQQPDVDDDSGLDAEERLLRSFRLRHILVGSGQGEAIENGLCLVTTKSVYVFRIANQELFEAHTDFDKCLAKEHVIDINLIEIIELSLVQNYLVLEVVKANTEKREMFKLVTFDVYLTQTILNSLLSKLSA